MLYMENTEQPGTAGIKNGSEWSNGTVQNFNRTGPLARKVDLTDPFTFGLLHM